MSGDQYASRYNRYISRFVPSYTGRFAPSPTGPLHLGSLCTALASWLDARAHGGRWLLRIEDVDKDRCRRDHALSIIESLRAHGLNHDGPVGWQSRREARYEAALSNLIRDRVVYRCRCSRRQIEEVLKKKNLEDEGRSTGEACDQESLANYVGDREGSTGESYAHRLGIQVRRDQGFRIRELPACEMTLAGSKASGQNAKAFSPVMPAERPYPGTCRALMRIEGDGAWRLIVPDSPFEFSDRLFGHQKSRLVESIGDFVVVRANGQSSYHLAVVVDDEKDGVTDVVRGDDLLSSTARHIALQQLLAYREIRYCHLPVLRDAQGQKLSKQQGAKALVPQHALENLRQAAQHLGLGALSADSLEGFLSQATVAWAARWIGSKSSSDRVSEAGN